MTVAIVPYGGGSAGETILIAFGTIFFITFQADWKKPLTRFQNLDAVRGSCNKLPTSRYVDTEKRESLSDPLSQSIWTESWEFAN